MKMGLKFLTPEAAGALHGLSHWTLRAWASKGKITSYKQGKRLVFEREQLAREVNVLIGPRVARVARSTAEAA